MTNLKDLLKERGLTRADFRRLGGFSDRTIDRIYNGTRKLSELEQRGLESLSKKRGRKKKQ